MDEKITINDKILQYGVLSSDKGYQLYLYPGMSVAELAFNVCVTIKLLVKDEYIEDKETFDKLVDKYYNDPQYAEVEK